MTRPESEGMNERLSFAIKALAAFLKAEWMVTHDWGGDRQAVLKDARKALRNLRSVRRALKGEDRNGR